MQAVITDIILASFQSEMSGYIYCLQLFHALFGQWKGKKVNMRSDTACADSLSNVTLSLLIT